MVRWTLLAILVSIWGCSSGGGGDGVDAGVDSGASDGAGDHGDGADGDGLPDASDGRDAGGDEVQIVPRGDRALGIALSGAVDEHGQEEPFEVQRAEMEALGADFINFALDWRMIEPGPSDDFSYLGLDPNRWETGGDNPPVSPDDVVRYQGTHLESGWMRARYVLEGDLQAGIHWTVPADAVAGTTLTLLLDLGGRGNRCESGDVFVALVLSKEAAAHAVSVARCDGGTFEVLHTAAHTGDLDDITARIERAGGRLRFWLDETEVFSLAADGPLADDARPWLYINGREDTAGTVRAVLDDWSIGSTRNRFDQPGLRYSVDPGFFDIIAAANAVYAGSRVGLSIRTINTTRVEIPNDLAALIDPATGRVAFGHQRLADRFDAFTAYLLQEMSDEIELVFVSVGNEIDVYLGEDEAAWDAYADFVEAVAPAVRTHLEALQGGSTGVPVGAKITHAVLERGQAVQARLDRIVEASDAVMYNFYPQYPDFTLAPAAAIGEAMDGALDRFDPSLPILITEFGVHSADPAQPVCGIVCPHCTGSEAVQAAHYRTLFEEWDERADRIRLVMLNWLTDIPCSTVEMFEDYYGISDPGFLSYLATLGLRRRDATRKQAFQTIATEARARGW